MIIELIRLGILEQSYNIFCDLVEEIPEFEKMTKKRVNDLILFELYLSFNATDEMVLDSLLITRKTVLKWLRENKR